jgi:type IV pilus assembly protein PilE
MSGRRRGFTLLELMVVVAVVAVLALIALPAYQEHLRKGRRAAAEQHLMDVAQRQQQYFFDSRAFATSVAALGVTTPSEVSDFYTIAITTAAGPPPTFAATATPIAGGPQAADLSGQALSIDNAGTKLPAGAW